MVTSIKQSPVLKGHLFLSYHEKIHMNWTSFKRSPILKDQFFPFSQWWPLNTGLPVIVLILSLVDFRWYIEASWWTNSYLLSIVVPEHVWPLPLYPALQLHRWLPTVLIQSAFLSQLSKPFKHSFISETKQNVI